MKVEFKDLSLLLKISVVSSLILGSLYLILFIVGIVQGIIGVTS